MVARGMIRGCDIRSGGDVFRKSGLGRCDAAQLPAALGRSRPRSRQHMAGHEGEGSRVLDVPTLYVQGELDGVNPPETSEKVAEKFKGPFERIILPGVGHFYARGIRGSGGAAGSTLFKDREG
jgi:pimeloyl-ACP methyl ester carboxylesterase